MNRTFLVLALALLGAAGCRTMGPQCGQTCGDSCAQPCGQECCEPSSCDDDEDAPRPDGCAKVAATRVGAAAIAKRVARAAMAVCSTAITDRSVGRSIRLGRTIARRATRATGAATDIGIRWVTRTAVSATARTTVAVSRIVSVIIVAAGIAAANQVLVPTAARSAAVDRVAITITTSIRDRRLLRRRIRITRCVVRGIFCWIIRLRLGRIEKAEGGVWKAEGDIAGRRCVIDNLNA